MASLEWQLEHRQRDLALSNSIDPPCVRTDRGDVLVALSPNTTDQLLLKRADLEQPDWFKNTLNPLLKASGTREIVDPDSGEVASVFVYGLGVVDTEPQNAQLEDAEAEDGESEEDEDCEVTFLLERGVYQDLLPRRHLVHLN